MRKFPSIFGSAIAAAAMMAAAAVAPAHAAQIFVQQSGNSPAGGGPNIITDSGSFVVGVAGSATLQNPLLVIVGAYNGVGTPSISFAGGVSPATIGTYGLTHQTASFTTGTAFAALGLSAGGSENFGNWSAADVANGFAAPTSFTLSAFALNTSLTSAAQITIDESGAAAGSFIIAYSCKNGTGSSRGCATNGDRAETVFTNTGLLNSRVPPLPEPNALSLIGGALVLFGLLRWRRAA